MCLYLIVRIAVICGTSMLGVGIAANRQYAGWQVCRHLLHFLCGRLHFETVRRRRTVCFDPCLPQLTSPRYERACAQELLAEWLAPISGAAASTRSGPQVVNALAAHGAGDEAFATRPGMAAALQADGYFCFPRLP